MVNKIFNTPQTRFAIIFQMAGVGLASFLLMRIILFIRMWASLDHHIFEWIYIFGQGLIYDFAFIGYFSIPFVILLLVLPNKWLKNIIFKFTAQVTGFLIVYGLCFGFVAEWFFWEEFKARFNFISVDYLIYRREVTDNILQSYPVFWILPVLLFITIVIFSVIRPSFVKAMDVTEKFSRRLVIAICLFLIPCAAFLFLNQSQRRLSDNNYVNELASNGPYQLFAAFRNNTLDYRQFYETYDDKILSHLLKEQVREQSSHYYHKGLYNIARRIEEKRPPRKLNVILISVESLSAKFLTRIGKQKNITPFMD